MSTPHMTLSVTAISGCPGELSESVMEYRISHLWVTSSNAKGHEKPLSSGGLWESFQAISATTNGTCMTNTHGTVSQGKLGNSRSLRSSRLGKAWDWWTELAAFYHLFCDLWGDQTLPTSLPSHSEMQIPTRWIIQITFKVQQFYSPSHLPIFAHSWQRKHVETFQIPPKLNYLLGKMGRAHESCLYILLRNVNTPGHFLKTEALQLRTFSCWIPISGKIIFISKKIWQVTQKCPFLFIHHSS